MYLSWSDTAGRIIPDGGWTSDSPEQDKVLEQDWSSGEFLRLRSDIYLSLNICHCTSLINDPQENLLSEVVSLTILTFTILIILNYLPLSLSATLSLWCGRNLRVDHSIECPHYRPVFKGS